MNFDSLPSSWQLLTLEEIQDSSGRAIVSGPFGSNIGRKFFVESGIPVIRGNNLSLESTKYIDDGYVFVTPEKAEELSSSQAIPGDLIFTAAGSIGQVGLIPEEAVHPLYIISNKQIRARINEAIADRFFVYYWLSSPEMVNYIQQRNTGSSVPLINLSIVRSLPIPLPPLDEQRRIAHILGSLDDKIELNRRMNQTLEDIARAIFKSWFVDFGPVWARSEGRDSGLPDEITDLFPDSFEESEQGLIPGGWEAVTLGQVIEIYDSKGIPLSRREREARPGSYPYYGATKIMDYVDDYLFDGIYVLMGEDGSVTEDDGSPVLQYVWGQFWVNNHAHVLQGNAGINTEQLYLALKNVWLKPFITGAVQMKLNQRNMKRIPFILASDKVNRTFQQIVEPLFSRIRANEDEIGVLIDLRDTLLPKLISGEFRV